MKKYPPYYNWSLFFFLMVISILFLGFLFNPHKVIAVNPETQAIEQASENCEDRGFDNWIQVDRRWGGLKVMCWNDSWRLKMVTIK